MKIEINGRGYKEYYDECLFIAFNYKKVKKNPNNKVDRFTSSIYKFFAYAVLCIFLSISLYIHDKEIIYLFLIAIITIFIILFLFALVLTKIRIKSFLNEKGTRIVKINKDGVESLDENKKLRIKWDEIHNIIINKYSICFLPKETSSIFLAIQVAYKGDVIKGIEKYKKEDLIIDNSNLYK